ncbi:TIR domain-containing protein [Pseudofrankia asymbiotica]|uniref:Guanylate cyclase domain-containing protein n=1 Tax=Pseudofrankia asymbiotica TaxID=1834516 RepID=A0A1V2IAK9_9ACTN|nr:TIR domain-containing protein [Pseudofrankia asymbiotica]ONH29461.1 hypothetical protein BL253_16400 [Pseudofrankia asymbiotica]
MTERLQDDEVLELARVFRDSLSGGQLLLHAGLPEFLIPTGAANSLTFWQAVSEALDAGGVDGGRFRILARAAEIFPANRLFPGRVDDLRAAGAAPGRRPGGSTTDAARGRDRVGATSGSGAGGLPKPATVIVLDAVGYSPRGAMVHLEIRRGLREIIEDAVADAGISPESLRSQDKGDGLLMVASSEVPKAVIGIRFVDELRRGLRSFNRTRNDLGRIRLRLALHHGDVIEDGTGWAGNAVIVACRLVDAPPIKKALDDHPADVALIVSSAFYDDVVDLELLGVDPAEYREVAVDVPKFSGKAWLTLPGRPGWVRESPSPAAAAGPATAAGTPAEGESANDELPGDAVKWDFLIAAAAEDADWCEWIAFVLEKGDKYRAHVETWDVQAGDHAVRQLEAAMNVAHRTIIVVSEHLEAAPRAQAVWMNKWVDDPGGEHRSVVPVILGEYEPAGLLFGIKPIRLRVNDPEAAEKELLSQIDRTVAGRYRPDAQPPFPGLAGR